MPTDLRNGRRRRQSAPPPVCSDQGVPRCEVIFRNVKSPEPRETNLVDVSNIFGPRSRVKSEIGGRNFKRGGCRTADSRTGAREAPSARGNFGLTQVLA